MLGGQQYEIIDMDNRKLLVIYGKAGATSFAIIPGWYVGNEKFEGGNLTAVDVELVDPLDQQRIQMRIREVLEKKGLLNVRASFWGAPGFRHDFEQSHSTEHSSSDRGRILVVDDDPGIRGIIKMYLEKRGYSVKTVSNANEASTLLKEGPLPNLMLLDIMMPGETGWQLLEELEHDSKLSKIPVIAISGLEKPRQGAEYDSKMLYDYLVKPFSMEELSRAVGKFIQTQVIS